MALPIPLLAPVTRTLFIDGDGNGDGDSDGDERATDGTIKARNRQAGNINIRSRS